MAVVGYACIAHVFTRSTLTPYMFAHVRYKAAHDVLFGNQLDLASRFDMRDDNEKGTILLNKIFQTYQDMHCIRHT